MSAIVHVVPTLHQYHAAAPGYGFEALAAVLEDLKPDVLAVELTERDLRERRPQVIKQEYQHCVFPYLDRHALPAVALEPPRERWEEFVASGFAAEQQFKRAFPARYAEYEREVWALFDELLAGWRSPAAVNSAQTDRLLEAKHARENGLFGPAYADQWERWNEHMAQVLAGAAGQHPGQRIVALAGVEHSYWLRRRLRELGAATGACTVAPRLDGEP